MTSNSNLTVAKKTKNDEFYTQLCDVENELQYYWGQLKGKVVYCNCDDPTVSNFWKYFDTHFDDIGIAALIATHYTPASTSYKLEIKRHPLTGERTPPVRTDLQGDGDFQSEECIQILREADVVVTNPPFSLFKEYVTQLIQYGKQFIVMGNMNIVSSRTVFRLIVSSQMWLGYSNPKRFIMPDGNIKSFGNIVWYTNVDIRKRHQPISLTCDYDPTRHLPYDNYDAINVGRLCDIPRDYFGIMGVPLTFLTQQCSDQFELLGIGSSKQFFTPTKYYIRPLRHNIDGTTTRMHIPVNNTLTIAYDTPPEGTIYFTANNTDKYLVSPYNRLLIRRKS